MRYLVVVLCFSLIVFCQRPPSKSFQQKVDHFDNQNNGFFNQKYYEYVEGKSKDSPVFFFLGGEAPVEFFEFQEVSAWNWAKEYGAWYISLEHRFYGDSNPTPDLSTENLRFLSSQQALADAAYFIESMKETFPGTWVVFGCSYSGSLSAWFRAKYPNLVVGSVAPSGPVLAEFNFTKFFNNFQNVAPPSCISATRSAVNQIETMLQSQQGLNTLSSYFNACSPLKKEDILYFKWTITEFMATSAQWQNPPGWQLTFACSNLTQNSNYVQNWGKALILSNNGSCNDFTLASLIDPMKSITLNNAGRSWFYQKCTEFGFFQVAYPGTSVFFQDIPMSFVDHCKEVFDKDLRPNVDWTNAYYGGLDIQGSNILFTNGHFDPWHTLSINENQQGVLAVTYSAGHCAPMTQPTDQDPEDLKQAREHVRQFLGNLLKKN